jgi:L-threonylcarbamoyladenylate synthase
MKTLYFQNEQLTSGDIAKIASLLQRDELVIFPTETVYGLATHAFSDAALLKIFTLKEREQNKPFTLHLSSLNEVEAVAK